MGILNYLPTFKVVEINRSTGLVAGHVLAQYLLDDASVITTTSGVEFLENGLILGLDRTLTVSAFVETVHTQPFLHFTEELNTLFSGLKYFAVEEDADGEIYPRLIGLYVGDTFTTNNYAGTMGATMIYAKVDAGTAKLTLQTSRDADTLFACDESTLPDGTTAGVFTYLGILATVV
jgi:hypothetical protein